ncbi:hypothetical protein YC2023_088530 [Brassica napus]
MAHAQCRAYLESLCILCGSRTTNRNRLENIGLVPVQEKWMFRFWSGSYPRTDQIPKVLECFGILGSYDSEGNSNSEHELLGFAPACTAVQLGLENRLCLLRVFFRFAEGSLSGDFSMSLAVSLRVLVVCESLNNPPCVTSVYVIALLGEGLELVGFWISFFSAPLSGFQWSLEVAPEVIARVDRCLALGFLSGGDMWW